MAQKSRNLPINSNIVIEKANVIAKNLNMKDFNCTSSWIQRFKKRRNIVRGTISGESKSAEKEAAELWINEQLPLIKEKYSPKDIINGDETGLYYKMLPKTTLKIKGEKCTGGKLSKERLTLWLCSSMEGE